MIRKISLLLMFAVMQVCVFAQIREIPQAVRERFSNQYPKAEKVEIKDQLVKVHIYFTMDSVKYMAVYENDGEWKETEMEYAFSKLPEDVLDGFLKSKYADWKVESAAIIYRPGGDEEYRVKVAKGDLQKRFLYFSELGRLKRDPITL